MEKVRLREWKSPVRKIMKFHAIQSIHTIWSPSSIYSNMCLCTWSSDERISFLNIREIAMLRCFSIYVIWCIFSTLNIVSNHWSASYIITTRVWSIIICTVAGEASHTTPIQTHYIHDVRLAIVPIHRTIMSHDRKIRQRVPMNTDGFDLFASKIHPLHNWSMYSYRAVVDRRSEVKCQPTSVDDSYAVASLHSHQSPTIKSNTKSRWEQQYTKIQSFTAKKKWEIVQLSSKVLEQTLLII